MPIRPDLQQLEKCIDDALRKNNFKSLKTLLQIDVCEDVRIKCTKQFFHKLDDLICRELNKKDVENVSTILVSIGRCSKNISILGQVGLVTMIKQGLVQKMVTWFEKSEEIILSRGNSKDEGVLNLTEDFFELLMAIYDISDEGKKQVMENFLPRICALATNSRVNICIQQETFKKINAMLDRMPRDTRKILSTQEMSTLMSSMGERIIYAGDYDLQVGIVEALCRMTTEKQRQELACQWFSIDFIANAFKGIKDCEFETDCRLFLNVVNGMLGDKRRVFTFPCLSAFLDKHELQIPADEKLEEFWIDFNLGSQSLSFYIAGDNEDHQWEAVTVPEEKVQMYSIEVKDSKKLLSIILQNTVRISQTEGKELLLYFDISLEITSVTQKIFGTSKYKEFTQKQGISVAKTSVHILFDENGSQMLVPESQSSPIEEEPVILKEKFNSPNKSVNPPKCTKNNNQEDTLSSQIEITTPSKRKMSEASMIVAGTDRYTVRSPVLLVNAITPRRRRSKPPQQKLNFSEKVNVPNTSENGVDDALSLDSRASEGRCRRKNTEKHIKTANIVEKTENEDTKFPNQHLNVPHDTLSDSQTVEKIDKPIALENMCGNKIQSKWACWTPVTTIKLCKSKRSNTLSRDTFNPDVGVNKNYSKQKSSSSISDDDSEETVETKYRKAIEEPDKIDKAAVVCKRNNQQQNYPKYSEQKNTENATQNDWHIESEATFKSVLLNKTTEESLIYKKKFILSKDVNTAVCNKSSPRKRTNSHIKSGTESSCQLNSWDLKQKTKREKSKEKGFTEAAESLITQINKRYKKTDDTKSTRKLKDSLVDNGFSKKSDVQLNKVQKRSYRKLKTTFVNVTTECPLDDVYNFNLSGADEPVIKLGIKEFQAATKETSKDNSIKLVDLRNHDELETSLRTKDKRMISSHIKKNLFSDTETEHTCDDGKTDISWLQGSNTKPQPAAYNRNKNVRKYTNKKSRPSLEKRQPRSIMESNKNTTKKENETVPDGRARLPRRAAKTKKNYKDLSNSESESEAHADSPKDNSLAKENIRSRTKTTKLPKKPQKVLSAETQKGLSKKWKNSSLQKNTLRENSLDFSPTSLSGSPSSIELMRCKERETEKNFTQDYDCTKKSPYPKISSPESLNSSNEAGGSGNSPPNKPDSPSASERRSPLAAPLFLPRQTPTKNNTVMDRRNINSVELTQETQNCNSDSDVRSNSSDKHLVEIQSPAIIGNHIQSKREENSSVSSMSLSIEERQKLVFDTLSDTTHESGPTQHPRFKRIITEDNASNSELDTEEEEMRAHLPSKRLCKMEDADSHSYQLSQNISPLSPKDISISEEGWGSDLSSGVGVLCEKINSEFKRKLDARNKIIEYFTMQSWKTAQQHLKTMNHQIQENRIKKLDKFKFIITEELENFEKDSQSLKDLEKEFVDFWERALQKLNVYQKNEQQRLRHLENALNKNVFGNSDFEESVFSSQMSLMKENMKTLQDKLLKQMQEEELHNIRRGLMSLFLAHGRNNNA
ncbi:synaptonemal complex protein 2 [Perognathus longimembris pacificus]|uniref:synaptonemal complex protein 2 n=1 Tax=Perognathus longimembris pacificus TaxID=214514 RepID=UPI0020195854|nr:synaptonemal complex protein 2 [Perognathus longimembris pacificus]